MLALGRGGPGPDLTTSASTLPFPSSIWIRYWPAAHSPGTVEISGLARRCSLHLAEKRGTNIAWGIAAKLLTYAKMRIADVASPAAILPAGRWRCSR